MHRCRTALVLSLALGACVRFGFGPEPVGDRDAGDVGAGEREGSADLGLDAGLDSHDGEAGAVPVIVGVSGPACIASNEVASLGVEAVDPAGGALSYAWSAATGTIAGEGAEVRFTPAANGAPCPQAITVVVTSSHSGLSSTAALELRVRNPADTDGDGDVDTDDFGRVAEEFGRVGCCPGGASSRCAGDLNRDCLVDVGDVSLHGAQFGASGCACATPLPLDLCSGDGWCWQHPSPVGQGLRGVWASGADDVWAVGEGGVVLHHDGTRWEGRYTPATATLNAIWGAGSTRLVAVGEDFGVFTYDGSQWLGVAAAPPAPQALTDVSGCGDSWFAVGSAGALVRSTPPVTVETVLGEPQLVGVWCRDPSHFFLASTDGVVRANTAGLWSSLRAPGDRLTGIWGLPGGRLAVVGRTAESSTVGVLDRWDGTQWTRTELGDMPLAGIWGAGATYVAVGHVAGPAPQSVMIVADPMTQYTYGGPSQSPLTDVWGTAGDHVVAVGDRGAVVRFDGTTVAGSAPVSGVDLRCAWGTSATALVVGGGEEALHHQGTSWERRDSTLAAVHGLWGAGPSAVFAVGEGGVARFDGSAWSVVFSSSAPLRAVWGASQAAGATADLVIAVGDGVAARKSGSSGWTERQLVGRQLRGVWGAGATAVYAVGSGVLRHDGSSWAVLADQPSLDSALNAVTGLAGAIFAVDGSGNVVFRPAGGAWSSHALATVPLYTVAAARGTVFAAGAGGRVFERIDDTTWYRTRTPTERDLHHLIAVGEELVVVGDAGSVLVHRRW